MTIKKKTTKKKAFDYKSIKTTEDAFKKCGHNIQRLEDLSGIPQKYRHSLWCSLLLMVVFDAINDGWEPDFSNHNEARHYPWPSVLSSGLGFSDSDYGCDFTYTRVGSRLCTNKRKKAEYILQQFEDLWKGWLLGVESEIKFEE